MSAGYLPQDGLTLSGRTVFAECMTVFDDLREMERELETLTHRMAELDPASAGIRRRSPSASTTWIANSARATAMPSKRRWARCSADSGFRKEDWQRRDGGVLGRLADAHRARQAAARKAEPAAAGRADEPPRPGGAQLAGRVSGELSECLRPDLARPLLPGRDGQQIVEIWNKTRPLLYAAITRSICSRRKSGATQLEAAYRNQRDRIEQLEAFINRFRAQATKAKQVQSRIKELEKIERIEIPPEEKTIHFTFPQPKPSGRMVAEFKNVSKSYGEKHVFGGANFIIERGDRIALVGVNGAGKSTLIKLLAGTEPLTAGEYTLGHNVEPDYFAQDQYKELDPDARMLDDIGTVAPRATETELRSLLGCFLFSEDDVFKTIGVLSRRRAQSLRAGADAAASLEFPAAGRADEPPGHARQGRAAGGAGGVYRHGGVRFARPLFHRQAGDAGLRSRRRAGAGFPGTTRIICGARRPRPPG